jgi:hypothetical protein
VAALMAGANDGAALNGSLHAQNPDA